MALIAYSLLGFKGPTGRTVDLLFGVPAAFRVVGHFLLTFRGTPLGALGIAVDLSMFGATTLDLNGDLKGRLMVAGLLTSNLVPGLWSLAGRRWGAVFGVVGTVVTVVAWVVIEMRVFEEAVLVMLGASLVLAWLADAAIAWWALQEWRVAHLDDAREL